MIWVILIAPLPCMALDNQARFSEASRAQMRGNALIQPLRVGQLGSQYYSNLATDHFEGNLHPLLLLPLDELKERTRVSGAIRLNPV